MRKCSKQKMLFLICLFLFLKEWPSLTSLRPSKTKRISKMKLNRKKILMNKNQKKPKEYEQKKKQNEQNEEKTAIENE